MEKTRPTGARVPLRGVAGGGRLTPGAFEAHAEAYPPGGLATFRRMQRDAQVRACLTTKRLSVLSQAVEIRPAQRAPGVGAGAAAARAAAVVEEQLAALPGGVCGVLTGALDALAMGYAVGEMIWAADGSLAKITWHDPARFTFHGDGWGEVEALSLTADPARRFPRSHFVVYTYQGRYGSPYGESDLVAAYRPWATKDVYQRHWGVALDRFGTPTLLGRVPAYADDADRAGFLALLKSVQNESALVYPGDCEVSALEQMRAEPGAGFEKAIEYQDRQIAKAILGQTLTTDTAGAGSYALGKVHEGVAATWFGALRRELSEAVLTAQVARAICLYWLGPDAPVPSVVLADLSPDELRARRELVADLLRGQVIAPGEDWIRRYLALPEG